MLLNDVKKSSIFREKTERESEFEIGTNKIAEKLATSLDHFRSIVFFTYEKTQDKKVRISKRPDDKPNTIDHPSSLHTLVLCSHFSRFATVDYVNKG